jgi:uncharacterized protein YjiS (DUF1127 family)
MTVIVFSSAGRRTDTHTRSSPGSSKPAQLLALIAETWRRRRSRTWLTELDDRMLKDIGITRADVEWEANKPFWMP